MDHFTSMVLQDNLADAAERVVEVQLTAVKKLATWRDLYEVGFRLRVAVCDFFPDSSAEVVEEQLADVPLDEANL